MADRGQKDRFVEILKELGGSTGNGRLREALGWDEKTYGDVRNALVADGIIVLGRGRGGSVVLKGFKSEEAKEIEELLAGIDLPDEQPVQPPKRKAPTSKTSKGSGANVGYEAQLWQMADALRGSMDAGEYKHVVLGLIFLKYISDAFEEQHAYLSRAVDDPKDEYFLPAGTRNRHDAVARLIEDPDEYRAKNIFWVPPEARWAHLKAQAKQPTIGRLVDDAMAGIERDNPAIKGVLPKEYARPALDKLRLGQIIDLISNIRVGDAESRSKDVLGRIYEYFLSQFASAEGKKGGEFYTPRCVVKLLVEMLWSATGHFSPSKPCPIYVGSWGRTGRNRDENRHSGSNARSWRCCCRG